MSKVYFENKEVFCANNIVYNEKLEKIEIGKSEFELEYVIGILSEQMDISDYQKVTIRYKNSQYDIFYLDIAGERKLKFILEEFQNKKLEEKLLRKEKEAHCTGGKEPIKKFLGIHHSFWILYVILILGFKYKSFGADQLENKFEYEFIYDVNVNKCVAIDSYKNKFSYQELNDPKFVGVFPKRPGELVFISLFDEMYVFTDTEERCNNYQKYFLEEMEKQLKEEESKIDKFDSFNLED